jgi:diketogulonate reductase-like aldo/keto reductase
VTGSMSPEYDREDLNIFDFALTDAEMQTLATL